MTFERKQISAIKKNISVSFANGTDRLRLGHTVHELPQTLEEQDLHSHFQISLPESVNSYSTPDLIQQAMVNIMYAKEKKQTGIP